MAIERNILRYADDTARQISERYGNIYMNFYHKVFCDRIENLRKLLNNEYGADINLLDEKECSYLIDKLLYSIENNNLECDIDNTTIRILTSASINLISESLYLYEKYFSDIRNILSVCVKEIYARYSTIENLISSFIVESIKEIDFPKRAENLSEKDHLSVMYYMKIFMLLDIITKNNLLAYDLETSSFLHDNIDEPASISQYSSVLIKDISKILYSREGLFGDNICLYSSSMDITNHYLSVKEMSEGASEVNGLTVDWLYENQTIGKEGLVEVVNKEFENTIRIGYNNKFFDEKVMLENFKRIGYYPSYHKDSIDMYQIYRAYGNIKSKSLVNIIDHFKLNDNVASIYNIMQYNGKRGDLHFHNAVYDSIATMLLFIKAITATLEKRELDLILL